MRRYTTSFALSSAAATLVACAETPPTVPDISSGKDTTTVQSVPRPDAEVIAGLIASDPLRPALISASVGVSNSVADAEIVFVSAAPGTFPGKDSIIVTNETRAVAPGRTELIDGGFDPISIGAEAEDLLELTAVISNGARAEPVYVKVPARRPPVVVRTVPQKGRMDVALTVQIEVVFSEPIDRSTVTASSLSLSENGKSVSGTLRISDDGLSAGFIPDNELAPGALYELNLTAAIRDLSGDALAQESPVTFRTAPEPGHIAFTLAGGAMYMMNEDGTNWVQLGFGVAPAWMPDGSLLYSWQECPQCTYPWQACAECTRIPWIRTSDGDVRPFLPEAVSIGWSFDAPAPTLDGSRVAFIRSRGSCRYHDGWCPIENFHELVIVTVRDFSLSTVPLPDGIVPFGRLSWSPDQSRVVFSCADKPDVENFDIDLCFVNTDGSRFVKFGLDNQYEWDPAWNPNTGVIAFTRSIDIGGDTWSYLDTIEGEDGKGLREYGYGEGAAWSPDGSTLLFCRSPLIAVSDGAQRVVYSDPHMPFLYDLAWGRK